MSAPGSFPRIIGGMQTLGRMVADETQEADVADAIGRLSDADLARLQALARLRARSLPGIEPSDLLHEAIVRALDGTRRWPSGVPILAFLAQSMRSIEHDHRRRRAQEDLWRSATPPRAAATDPATSIAAREALDTIFKLFAADPTVLRIIEGMAFGRSAAEVRARHELSEMEYDSARKRLRRALLRLEP
jgi:RNA polymerase sigma-70 factor (ECF subfamily)